MKDIYPFIGFLNGIVISFVMWMLIIFLYYAISG